MGAAARSITESGNVAPAQPADVTDLQALVTAFAAAVEAFGQVHAVVNCAGVQGPLGRRSHEVSLVEFDATYAVNLRGALAVSQVALPHMLEHRYGRIVHVASIAGKEGNPQAAAYSASKAAVITLTKSIGKDVARTGVLVNCIAPAVIETPMLGDMSDEHVAYMIERIPLGRMGTAEEAAGLIAYLASEGMGFSTGACFDLSGGRAVY